MFWLKNPPNDLSIMKIMHLWFQATTCRFTCFEDCKQLFLCDSPVIVKCWRLMRFPIDFLSIYSQTRQGARMFQLKYSTFLNQISSGTKISQKYGCWIPDEIVVTSNFIVQSRKLRNSDFHRVSDCQNPNQASLFQLYSIALLLFRAMEI